MKARLFRLQEIHQRVDAQLRAESQRRMPDQFALLRLTEMKLRVKMLMQKLLPQPVTG